ncbi:hypothetical protein FKW77_008853 [Venturia effusa]|uniref:Uncharacterized protein n=1 Tax=Venturia effusa TaxID=50376 RepID=A0A517LBH1_9PEZI|nr:hypothetical protein FKW77_008853 [Venturia effusa]
MKLSNHNLSVLGLSTLSAMCMAVPAPEISTGNQLASSQPTNATALDNETNISATLPLSTFQNISSLANLEKRKSHKSSHYYLSAADGLFLSQDEKDFIPGSIREDTPRSGPNGALYRKIRFSQRGHLRLRANTGKNDVIFPNAWYCNNKDKKRNPGGCYGRNFIDPRPEILAAYDPNLKIRYEGNFAYITSGRNGEIRFDKVNDKSGRDHYRYVEPGMKFFDRKKWQAEQDARPACNRKGDIFGIVNFFGILDKICDAYENLMKNGGLKGKFDFSG